MARILVVDDSAQNLTLIEVYLRDTEFEVVTATGGLEAIETCMQQAFELILLDVVMPGIDGFEVCRRLKNDPRTAFIPVIFLTARLGDESEKLAAYQLGAVDYIQKPVNREELVARIRVMLRLEEARSRLDRENASLRRQLGSVQHTFGTAADSLRDLQRLRQEWATSHEPALLVVDGALRVQAADEALRAWLGELVPGEVLGSRGLGASRLARLIEDGARSADLTLPLPDGGHQMLQVQVRELADGLRVVVLQNVTGVRAAERSIERREPRPAAPAAPVGESSYRMTDFVGRAPAVQQLSDQVAKLRQTRSTVLIYGESGTGKELVARALHFDGENRNAPFVPLHCGAIAPELIESELFGHEKGAFTGAQQAKEGLFRAADGGTIFLDEIAETSPAVQVTLLRVLQRGEIRPVGASLPRIVDVRVLAATNCDLLQMVRAGKFRADLYYRLEVVTLNLPPLRERLVDLPLLVDHFIAAGNRRHNRLDRPVRAVSRGALERMLAYPWPGNVRELENAIERAFALGVGEVVQEEDLPPQVLHGAPSLGPTPVVRTPGGESAVEAGAGGSLRGQREAVERQAMAHALRECDGDKAAAAQRLGMSRSTFYRRARELGL